MYRQRSKRHSVTSIGGVLLAGLIAAGLPQAVCADEATAIEPTPVVTEEALPAPQPEVTVETTAAPAALNVYHPLVRYRAVGLFPGHLMRKPQKQMTLLVEDPCCCGHYAEVPVCVPCCCEEAAKVCERPGVLGRYWVDHQFDCGFCVSVLFRTRGDVVVVYR